MAFTFGGIDGDYRRVAPAGVVAGIGGYLLVRQLTLLSRSPIDVGAADLPFVVLALSVLYAGYWLLRTDVDAPGASRVAAWSFLGLLGLVAVAVWLGGGRTASVEGPVRAAIDVGTVGAGFGLLVGLEGERHRSDEDARLAEERFAFFNRLLRHHLLNGVAVVRGYAELLASTEAEPPAEVELIRQRSDEVVDLVRNIETLGRAATGELPRQPVDPVPPLLGAVEAVQRDHPEATVELTIDFSGRILANARVAVVFEAAIAAVVEADGRRPVTVTGSTDGDLASVTVEGATVEPAGDPDRHGPGALGLFVAETLVDYFGGSIDRHPPGGLVVRLPRA